MTPDNPEANKKMVEVAQPTKMPILPAEKQVPKRPVRFMDLSVDIKTLIVAQVRLRLVQLQETIQLHAKFQAAVSPELIARQVHRPTELKNLCLTCSQMHKITVRKLYHEVTLEVGSSTDAKLTSFINPRNIGLPHIRKLDLYLAEVADKCNQLQQAHFAIRMILEFLPENILEKFSWHPWSPFLADNLVLLYKKQRRMEWLEGIALDRNVLP